MLKNSRLRLITLGVLSLLCALSMAFAHRASAENEKLDFKLTNKTGYPITKIFIGPNTVEEWGDNIITEKFADDETLDISFSPKATADKWDMKVVYEDGSSHQWLGLDLSKIEKLTLHYDAATNTTSAD